MQRQRSAEVPQMKLEIETLTKKIVEAEAAAAEVDRLKSQVQQLNTHAQTMATELESANIKLERALVEIDARARTEQDLKRELDMLRANSADRVPSMSSSTVPTYATEIRRQGMSKTFECDHRQIKISLQFRKKLKIKIACLLR